MLKNPPEVSPPAWKQPFALSRLTQALKEGVSPKRFGLVRPITDLPRLKTRYRLAVSFQGLLLHGYSARTVHGYNALVRIHLCYSVLEMYQLLFGVSIAELLDTDQGQHILRQVFTSKEHSAAFSVVRVRLEERALRKRLERGHIVLSDVLAAFRHTFVHGELSPGAKDGDTAKPLSTVITRLARRGCPFMLNRLDEHLHGLVTEALGPEASSP